MSLSIADIASPPQPPIDRYGRYLLPGPDDEPRPHTRATTIAKTIADTTALEKWKMRMVAAGIGRREELYALASSHDPETDRKVFEEITEKAMEAAGSSTKASLGTALHRFTERLDAGEIGLDDVPDQWRERCAVYQQTMTKAGIVTHREYLEQRLIDDRYGVAGTTDQIVTLPNEQRVIADKKTGANLDFSWLEIAIQLAIYANHTARATWDPTLNRWVRAERVNVSPAVGLIIHLPALGEPRCDLYQLDLEQGYAGYLLAMEVREWRKTKNLSTRYGHFPTPTPVPEVTERDWLQDRIKALTGNTTAVTALIAQATEAGIPLPLPKPPTTAQVDAMDRILGVIEAAHKIPFGAPRPGAVPTTSRTRSQK